MIVITGELALRLAQRKSLMSFALLRAASFVFA